MRLHSLTQKAYYYRPAVKATVNQLKETSDIITSFINRGKPNTPNDYVKKLFDIPIPFAKKCWFSDDYKLNSTGKKWIIDLLDRFDLDKNASLSDLVIAVIQDFKKHPKV